MLAVLVALLNPWSSALAQTEPFVIDDIRVEGLERMSAGCVFVFFFFFVWETFDI